MNHRRELRRSIQLDPAASKFRMWLERLYDEFTTPRRGRVDPGMFLGIMFVALGLLVFVVGGAYAAMTGQPGAVVFAVGFLFFVLGAGAVIAVSFGQESRKGASSARTCPKCGALPSAVLSAHGLTKCAQCGEAYFVS